MASFLFCYQMRLDRLSEGDLSYTDFLIYLNNLPPESQLSRVIRIRMAKDDELDQLTDAQKEMRDTWIQEHLPQRVIERDKNQKFDNFMAHIFGRR